MATTDAPKPANTDAASSVASDTGKTAAATAAVKSTVQQTFNQSTAVITAHVPRQFTILSAVRQARVNLLQRQVRALAAKPASTTTSASVKSLRATIQLHQSALARFGAVSTQSSTPAPAVPANGWVLHGHIRGPDSQPVAKLTVALTDQEKTWFRNYGYAFTDASGYFSLSYAPPAAAPAPAPAGGPPPPAAPVPPTGLMMERAAPPAGAAGATAGTLGAGAAAPPPQGTTTPPPAQTGSVPAPASASSQTAQPAGPVSVYLEVLNESGQPVYLDTQAFTLVPGAALYRDVTLASTDALGSPPSGASEPPGVPK